MSMERIHATCIALNGKGVLLQGKSGLGKSDLALRLIDEGWDLVADDYTELEAQDDVLYARSPEAIQGLLEVRGLGVMRLGCVPRVPIVAVFDLRALNDIERLPEPVTVTLQGLHVPLYSLYAFEPSAPAKVRLALKAQTQNLFDWT